MKSRSVSFVTFSSGWPVCSEMICSSSARRRMISLAWISMSTAWPCAPPCGWCSSTRAFGSANRFSGAPASNSTAAAEAARPITIVDTSHLMYCIVS